MSNVLVGVGTIVVACILVIVLAIQIQIRDVSKKMDQVLGKLSDQ